jgi:hypothetical protein
LKWQTRAPWDGKRDRYALALATGRSVIAASAEAAISQRTAERWAKDPEILVRVSELRGRMIDMAIGQIADALCKSVEVMVELLGEESPAIRLRAAEALQSCLLRLKEHAELDRRVLAIETTIAGRVLDVTGGNGQATSEGPGEEEVES